MRNLLFICSILLFVGALKLPIGYYTLLRIIVTIASVLLIVKEYNGELNTWIIIFGIIAILFNPIIPVYLNNKYAWTIIDLIVGAVFVIKALTMSSVSKYK